jgi:hypothetical protein
VDHSKQKANFENSFHPHPKKKNKKEKKKEPKKKSMVKILGLHITVVCECLKMKNDKDDHFENQSSKAASIRSIMQQAA